MSLTRLVPGSTRAARPLLALALFVAASGAAAAVAVDAPGGGSERAVLDPAARSTTTLRPGRPGVVESTIPVLTTASTAAGPSTTSGAPATTGGPGAAPTTAGSTPPSTARPPTGPPVTSPPTTAAPPPTSTPSHLASVLVQNDLDMPLDLSLNAGFLRVGPRSSVEVQVSAQLEASGNPFPPGSDIVTVSIPPDFGSPDAGCGSHRVAQLFEPGGRHLLQIVANGTCQLLGGSAKPDFRVTAR